MSGRDAKDEIDMFRDRLERYDRESGDGDEPLVTLLERSMDIMEELSDSVDALENRVDVLEQAVESA